MNDEAIFHLALVDDWESLAPGERYAVSTRGASLADVGFIHASTRGQTVGVANRFYADVDELVVVTIDPSRLDVELRWEPPAPGGAELFPHIYGPLDLAAVTATRRWFRSPTGWALDSA